MNLSKRNLWTTGGIGLALTTGMISCGMFGGGGEVIANAAKLLSSELVSAQGVSAADATPCVASASTCTPAGFKGRVFAASAMLQSKSDSSSGYAMTFLADSDAVIERPDEGKTGSLTFDLTNPAVFSGKISIPAEDEMPSSPSIPRVEIAFDYLDATFELDGTSGNAVDGTYTVRTIFVKEDTIDGLAVTGGDLLIKVGDGDFQWCSAAGCSTTRPSAPYQLQSVVDGLASAAEREGNKNYGYYSVDLSTALDVTYADISDPTRLWTLDFNITDAINWTAIPSTFATVEDILQNFVLPYACNFQGCPESEGIKAALTIGAAGSATTTN